MPARKSDARKSDVSVARFVPVGGDTVMATDTPSTEPAATPAGAAESTGPQDLTLPKSIITRLAKGMLPPNTQIQANAILALTKSATVFISHLADAANEFTTGANRKTITPHDVFNAIDEIEYGFMREKLEAEFAKFNEVQTSKRSTYRKKVAAAKKAASQPSSSSGVAADVSMISTASTTAGGGDEAGGTGSSGQARAAKKARLDPSASSAAAGGGGDDSRMDVDEEVSDAETVPEEQEEGGDEDEDEEDDEEEEEDEEEDDEEGGGEDGDELEEREAREDEDEALDDDSD
ncbi:DNA polymerase epsilon subunit D [Dichotomopilus funicola]|uniref:DNA polymerase epsilon subunit D n=1 Tax=Dichotomopilus funicola TaxID=1934379 RepID=A0AAN6V1Y6_9PEZI|nr:DNA polymerase epsilon subunit D [Dichotomopilus funicola]